MTTVVYICTVCGEFIDIRTDTLYSGEVLRCDRCKEDTVIDLDAPNAPKKRVARYTVETERDAALIRISELEAEVIHWRDAWAKAQVEVDTRPWPEDAKMKIFQLETERDDALAILNEREIQSK
jgi:DNA-directed RNA polymerase subunit RPC12/RpoP